MTTLLRRSDSRMLHVSSSWTVDASGQARALLGGSTPLPSSTVLAPLLIVAPGTAGRSQFLDRVLQGSEGSRALDLPALLFGDGFER